ncbi:uncharacterized protein G2W53_027391 [Senna tora]|uniref:Uncharacterized protein n=1 Tax=Senna tora TaxID=362788 RepID=A0A834TJD5_9FABA|nr:uncharacterized protein G2W53_027391 [Senna tora]
MARALKASWAYAYSTHTYLNARITPSFLQGVSSFYFNGRVGIVRRVGCALNDTCHLPQLRLLATREASSSPSSPASPDYRVLAVDILMAIDRDSFSEESLRAFIDNCHAVTHLDDVPYESTVYHPEEEDFFTTSGRRSGLLDHYEEGVRYHDLPARIHHASCNLPDIHALAHVDHIFHDNAFWFNFCVTSHPFLMSLLCHDGLVPNVWVCLRGFEEVYTSVGGFAFFTAASILAQHPRSMGNLSASQTYAQYMVDMRDAIVIPSTSSTSGGVFGALPIGSDSPRSASSPSHWPPLNQVQKEAKQEVLDFFVNLLVKLLYTALLGIHGVNADARIGFPTCQVRLASRRGFEHIAPAGANSVKKELASPSSPPLGFGPLISEDKKDRDDTGSNKNDGA